MLQVIAALIANLGTINTGMVFGFSAVAIPQLEKIDSIIPIDKDQASWIGKNVILLLLIRLSSLSLRVVICTTRKRPNYK